jgi:hypothetical protein
MVKFAVAGTRAKRNCRLAVADQDDAGPGSGIQVSLGLGHGSAKVTANAGQSHGSIAAPMILRADFESFSPDRPETYPAKHR